MSNSQEFRQELLSAYLDDAVTPDERATVERMMDSDPSMREELEILRGLRSDVQSALRVEDTLGDDFSDRVWEAVVAQGQELPADHPVQLAQKEPTVTPTKLWVAALTSLAAAVLYVVVWRGLENQDPGIDELAENVPAVPDSPEPTEDVRVDQTPNIDITPEVIVQKDPPTEDLVEQPSEVPQDDATQIVQAPPKPEVTPNETPGALQRLSFTILVEVELTKRGVERDEMGYALETAGIKKVKPYEVKAEQIQTMVKSEAIGEVDDLDNQQGDTSIMLVQASGKAIDRFLLSLFGRTSTVSGVRFRMAMDPELETTIDEIKKVGRDASPLNHSAMASYLRYGGVQGRTMFPRSNKSFVKLDPEKFQNLMKLSNPTDEGPDIPTQILVLVREASTP